MLYVKGFISEKNGLGPLTVVGMSLIILSEKYSVHGVITKMFIFKIIS